MEQMPHTDLHLQDRGADWQVSRAIIKAGEQTMRLAAHIQSGPTNRDVRAVLDILGRPEGWERLSWGLCRKTGQRRTLGDVARDFNVT